jgi:hypothetical protein
MRSHPAIVPVDPLAETERELIAELLARIAFSWPYFVPMLEF